MFGRATRRGTNALILLVGRTFRIGVHAEAALQSVGGAQIRPRGYHTARVAKKHDDTTRLVYERLNIWQGRVRSTGYHPEAQEKPEAIIPPEKFTLLLSPSKDKEENREVRRKFERMIASNSERAYYATEDFIEEFFVEYDRDRQSRILSSYFLRGGDKEQLGGVVDELNNGGVGEARRRVRKIFERDLQASDASYTRSLYITNPNLDGASPTPGYKNFSEEHFTTMLRGTLRHRSSANIVILPCQVRVDLEKISMKLLREGFRFSENHTIISSLEILRHFRGMTESMFSIPANKKFGAVLDN